MGRSFRRTSSIILLALLLSILPITALAADYSAELSALHFDIALQADGRTLITETRKSLFTGDHEFTRCGVNNVFTGTGRSRTGSSRWTGCRCHICLSRTMTTVPRTPLR